MKGFKYLTAINQLKLGKEPKLNEQIRIDRLPLLGRTADYVFLFLPYLKIIGDSREQNRWIEIACEWYGIAFEWAKKGKGTENLKEGDYTFQMVFANKTYDYTGTVAYERKGSVSELFENLTERDRIEREFGRFKAKGYKKVVLMLEFGKSIPDLYNATYKVKHEIRQCNDTVFASLMSWKQPNRYNFDIIQSESHQKLFAMMLLDMYYYFRNELRNECIEKGLLEE